MSHEDQVLYLEYRKKQNTVLNDLRGLEFIISFFLGGTFTGISKYSSNDIISNILLVTVAIMLALIYFFILISHKKEFNKRLISAIENNILSMLNNILLRTKGTKIYIFYPVIRLRISFVNVITTPPARVRNPLESCDGSWV